jgi:hypothetical protein
MGGDYQLALGPVTKPITVKVVYTYQPDESDLERLSLGGIDLPRVKINKSGWMVIPPPDYVVASQETKMQTSNLFRSLPAFVQIWNTFVKRGFYSPALMPSLNRVLDSATSERLGFMAGDASQVSASLAERGAESEEVMGDGFYGGRGGKERFEAKDGVPQPAFVGTPTPTKPQEGAQAQQKVAGVRLVERGRRTLPVDLVPTPGGPLARFTGFGETELVIGLSNRTRKTGQSLFGFILVVAVGMALARRTAKSKVFLIVVVLFITSLLALWQPAVTDFANGAFIAGAALILLYVVIASVRFLWNKLIVRWTTI